MIVLQSVIALKKDLSNVQLIIHAGSLSIIAPRQSAVPMDPSFALEKVTAFQRL